MNPSTLAPGLYKDDSNFDPAQEQTARHEFPEGGARAWGVAFGTSLAVFCTLGYVNSFGYVEVPILPRTKIKNGIRERVFADYA